MSRDFVQDPKLDTLRQAKKSKTWSKLLKVFSTVRDTSCKSEEKELVVNFKGEEGLNSGSQMLDKIGRKRKREKVF